MINAQNPLNQNDENESPSLVDQVKGSRFAYELELIGKKIGQMNKWAVFGVLIAAQLAVVLVGPKVVEYMQGDDRSNASIANGPALIVLSPSKTTVARGEFEQTQIFATTDGHPVVGFQLVADVTGSVPGNLAIVPETIPGLTLVKAAVEPVSGGSQIRLVYLSNFDATYMAPGATQPGGFKPFSTTAPVKLGTITFYGQRSGTMTVAFVPEMTMIIESGTNQDLASIPAGVTYTFGGSGSSPSPSVAASTAPSPSPSSVASPVATVNPTPSSSPAVASPSPSATTSTKPGKGNNKDK